MFQIHPFSQVSELKVVDPRLELVWHGLNCYSKESHSLLVEISIRDQNLAVGIYMRIGGHKKSYC